MYKLPISQNKAKNKIKIKHYLALYNLFIRVVGWVFAFVLWAC